MSTADKIIRMLLIFFSLFYFADFFLKVEHAKEIAHFILLAIFSSPCLEYAK